METKEIILAVLDTRENFALMGTQNRIGKRQWKNPEPIETREEFDAFINSIDSGQPFILACHVFQSDNYKGYHLLINSDIERDYSLKAILITAADANMASQDLVKREDEHRKVYSYTTLREDIRSGKILPYYKADVLFKGNELKKTKEGIFLSHSSKDRSIVENFKDKILHEGLEYDLKKIMLTSNEEYTIPAGQNIPNALRKFLKEEMGLFIQFISRNYVNSRVCTIEEGAAWCLLDDTRFIPIIISDEDFSTVSWVQLLNKAIKIDNKDSIINIYQDRKDFFDGINIARFVKKVDEFIKALY